MYRNLSQRARKQDGFTLIELIVVVAILGILAAVLTPRVLDAIERARTNAALASAKQIQLAMERYLIQTNNYPAESAVENPTELATVLATYTNLQASSIDTTGFVYAGFTNADGTTHASQASTTVKSYQLQVTFTDGAVTYVITPTGVGAPPTGGVVDNDPS